MDRTTDQLSCQKHGNFGVYYWRNCEGDLFFFAWKGEQ